MNINLYYHKTDGGAEYLCSEYVLCNDGSKEGAFENSKYIVRLDGKNPELSIKDDKSHE